MRMNEYQKEVILELLSEIKNRSPFYAEKFKDIDMSAIRTQEDFETLPFTDKGDLREAYPLGLAAVPERDIVRIHSSSGTTGTPVVIPYTKKDVEDWAVMFERCYRMAGITEKDRIQITPGYGLWTAGIGFQAGCERLGAMAVPMGPGNTDKQIRMMEDLQSTVLCATSSYALLLAEEIKKRGIKDRLALRKGVIGSERWGEKMRNEIASDLGVEFYDIYGLTEIYGPGIGISCDYRNGIHMWDDYLYFEIIDPKTGETVPDGTVGELVITTLRKEGAPLIRYRTHDMTRIIPGECPCGSRFPRIDIIVGRTDDMIKVKGVNMFPAQFDEVLSTIDGATSEYQVMIDHLMGKDQVTVYFETDRPESERPAMERELVEKIKSKMNITVKPMAVNVGYLFRGARRRPIGSSTTGTDSMREADFIQRVFREAAPIVLGGDRTAETKDTALGVYDVVTDSDVRAEEFVLSRIAEEFPEDSVISEETHPDAMEGERCWVLDPIDGTMNYTRGIPFFGMQGRGTQDGMRLPAGLRRDVRGHRGWRVPQRQAHEDRRTSPAQGVPPVDRGLQPQGGGVQGRAGQPHEQVL